MKPNIFEYHVDTAEDFFSRSLAYIANMFPGIGQNLVQRIAVLAGKPPTFFGSFESCTFVGRVFPEAHDISKPDLEITCSGGTIYFENKLETRISFDQVRRHADLTRRNPKYKLIFVSNIQHKNPALRSLPGYLHPRDTDHYVWADLLPAFESYSKNNSVAANILADFKTALKANGMIGRTIKGAKGSLYTARSEAAHLALRQLWDVLKELGYKLAKKSAHEMTLRVYPSTYGGYPLLNPRFRATAAHRDEAWDRDCLELTVISKGDRSLSRYLKKFRPTQDCVFLGPEISGTSYTYHGWFIMPVGFVGRGTNVEIDFRRLTKPLQKVLIFLSKAA